MALNRLLDKNRDPLAKDASGDRPLAFLSGLGTLFPVRAIWAAPSGMETTAFLNDIGVIGSMAGREVIDLMGLTNPEER
jgi:hypothetical protein